jgi:hypothetical protein
MRRVLCTVVFLVATTATMSTVQAGGPIATEQQKVAAPAGWFLAGGAPTAYEVGKDAKVKHGGASSAYLKSTKDPEGDFGTLMQTVSAKKFRGKRLRFSAWVKTDKLADWAGLWMRVDGKSDATLAFDNMQDRAIKGTTEWAQYEVVLDIAKDADSISFGTLLVDTGSLWIDDVKLEVVAKTVKTTNGRPRVAHDAPENLDFEQ